MKKVLMASSSMALLSRNSSFLMSKGFLFFTASSGAEALKLHQKEWFDLILVDLDMEDMDGCTLCAEIHKADGSQRTHIVIICLDNEDHLQRVKQSNASAILLRPINPTHLLITIGSFIDMQLARSKRVEFKGLVILQTEGEELRCNSVDISATGLRLESVQPLNLGRTVSCQFELPDIGSIQVNGEIVRDIHEASSPGKKVYGVKFVHLPFSQRSSIERYIIANDHLGVRLKPHRPLERSNYYQQVLSQK